MIQLTKDCACTSHQGPHELAMRDAAKARRLALLASIGAETGRTRAQDQQALVVVESIAAESARDTAEHCRWMHARRLASFCRGCWQGFGHDELPAVCGCGREHPAQPRVDLIAAAQRWDDRGAWPPRDATGERGAA